MNEWLILSPSMPGRFDGIGDYAWHLARALGAHGETRLVVRTAERVPAGVQDVEVVSSWRDLADEAWRARARTARGVVVQYLPQAFLRGDLRGFLRWLDEARRAARPVVLTIHEYWPPADGRLRRAALRAVYRRVLSSLLARSTHVVCSQPQAVQALEAARVVVGCPASVVPVGSNIERRGARAEDRGGRLVLFGQPAAMHEPTMAAFGEWLSRHAAPLPATWIGRSSEEMRAYWQNRVQRPIALVHVQGGLAADVVSADLLGATVGLAPYVNGASTRRTTLTALLEHGLPVVGLDGPETSDLLRESGAILFSAEGDPAAFVRGIDALAGDAGRRARMSRAADRLFHDHLSWPCIARAYLAALGATAARP
jgi:hypothetical protein